MKKLKYFILSSIIIAVVLLISGSILGGSGGKDYTNLVVLRIDIDANITDNAGMGFVTAEYTKKFGLITLGTAYLTLINKGDPLATVYGDADLNYELNFGRS